MAGKQRWGITWKLDWGEPGNSPETEIHTQQTTAWNSQTQKEALKEKQSKIEALNRKLFQEKERLTSEIIIHGLWQTSECVDTKLPTYHTSTAKLNALKIQLQFRRNVLGQLGNKTLFQMSSAKDGKFSVPRVTENLKTLITFAASNTSEQEEHISFLVGKRIRHKFQDSAENMHW